MTLQLYQTTIFDYLEEPLTSSVEVFLVRSSVLQEKEEALKILEEHCFSKLQERPNKSNHAIYSLKTLKGCYRTTKGTLSELSSIRWMNWGMTLNGKCLTAKIFGVPQNRERVFIIGHSRNASSRKVFPITGTSTTINDIDLIAHGKRQSSLMLCKLDKPYIDGKFTSMHKASIRDIGTEIAGTITARYYKGLGANGDNAVLEVKPVLTPDRLEKRQNGRRFKEDGEPMFTLTAQDRHGVMIKEATKQGYDIAHEGDSINLAVPGSKTRRGRVGKQTANTLDTSCNRGILDGVRIRKLTPRECWRLQGFPDWAFDKAQQVNSDSQLYKQAGNSVTVNVIAAIAKELY